MIFGLTPVTIIALLDLKKRIKVAILPCEIPD